MWRAPNAPLARSIRRGRRRASRSAGVCGVDFVLKRRSRRGMTRIGLGPGTWRVAIPNHLVPQRSTGPSVPVASSTATCNPRPFVAVLAIPVNRPSMRRMANTPSVTSKWARPAWPARPPRAPAPGSGEVPGGTDRVKVDRKTSTYFAFSDRLVRADAAGNPNTARHSAWERSWSPATAVSSSSLGGDHIELRHIAPNTRPARENVAVIAAPLPPIA